MVLFLQMGSKFKSAVLEEQTVHAIKQWHADVKKKRKQQPNSKAHNFDNDHSSTTRSVSISSTPDASSHRRSPTLAEFASPAGKEIVEEEPYQRQEIFQNDEERIVEVSVVSHADNSGGVQLQMPMNTSDQRF